MILIGKKADIITRQAIYREAHSLLTVSQLKLSTNLDGQTLPQKTHQKGNYGTGCDPDMSVQAFTSSTCFCTSSTCPHVKVSLSQTMYPKLLPVTWLQPCTLGISGQWLMGDCICACLHSFLQRQSEGLWEQIQEKCSVCFHFARLRAWYV